MKYICDTNFIIRYLLGDDPVVFAQTKEVFDQVKDGQVELVIEQTVFTELVFVLSSFYKVPKGKIVQVLSELLTYKGIHTEKDILALTLTYYTKHHLHIVDCLLLAKAKITNTPVLSFDQELNGLLAQ